MKKRCRSCHFTIESGEKHRHAKSRMLDGGIALTAIISYAAFVRG